MVVADRGTVAALAWSDNHDTGPTCSVVQLYLLNYFPSLKVAGPIPDELIGFFNLPNPSSRTMALRLTQPLTEMSTRNLPGGKERLALKADTLNAICEPIV